MRPRRRPLLTVLLPSLGLFALLVSAGLSRPTTPAEPAAVHHQQPLPALPAAEPQAEPPPAAAEPDPYQVRSSRWQLPRRTGSA